MRLRNIEDTEKAKRELFEAKQAAVEEEEVFAADRCSFFALTRSYSLLTARR